MYFLNLILLLFGLVISRIVFCVSVFDLFSYFMQCRLLYFPDCSAVIHR